MKKILFSPPDINEDDIEAVVKVLRSGWITTGPQVASFSQELSKWSNNLPVNCLTSATAGLELSLRVLDIGPGDEVITTPFTFTATASVIINTGAKLVFADIENDSFNICAESIRKKITEKTKAVISVDYAGFPCDFSSIKAVLSDKSSVYSPKKNTFQEIFTSIPLISDASHSFGAEIDGVSAAAFANFTSYSFHAVKNLTTAEGGALVINTPANDDIDKIIKLISLHGQNKDAFNRNNWEYDVILPGLKRNMTDIQAALGLSQLKRYRNMLSRRKNIFDLYCSLLQHNEKIILPSYASNIKPSFHIFPIRIKGYSEQQRNMLISELANHNITVNVHFIPLPMLKLYKNMGYDINNYPLTYKKYSSLLTLPLNTMISDQEVHYIAKKLEEVLLEI